MPAYHYQCVACQQREVRIGGVDDHLAICVACGHLMLRLDHEIFAPYFDRRVRKVGGSDAQRRE
jgi:hypothetical protein